jgi:hypothetical protein
MERGKEELERARKRELEMLLQRYHNVKRGLQGQQNIIKAKTGNILLKHAANKKTDVSGSAAINVSMGTGTFGPLVIKRRPSEIDSLAVSPQYNDPITSGRNSEANTRNEESAETYKNTLPPIR